MSDDRKPESTPLPREPTREVPGQPDPRDWTPEEEKGVLKAAIPPKWPRSGFIHSRLETAVEMAEKGTGRVKAARDELTELLRSEDEAQLRKVAEAVIEMLDPDSETNIRLEIVLGKKDHPQVNRDRLIVDEVERLIFKGETKSNAVGAIAKRRGLSKSRVRAILGTYRPKTIKDAAFIKEIKNEERARRELVDEWRAKLDWALQQEDHAAATGELDRWWKLHTRSLW